ncbi:MAG: DUF4919 domain-containing protein [Acidobacteriia bacterium]|nr:DUF4919 domain-containing protein [Terriglobia bacterium]
MRMIGLVMVALLIGAAPAAEAAPPSYAELVAKLKSGDTGIDYQALRFAYAETPGFDPYARPAVEKRDLIRAMNSGNLDQAQDYADEILSANYTDMDAHFAFFLIYDRRGEKAKAEFHLTVLQGLLKSFADSGDGMSEDTAMIAVAVPEEYAYLGLKGYQVLRQGLAPSSAGPMDVFSVTTQDNQGTTIYFNARRILAKMKKAPEPAPAP